MSSRFVAATALLLTLAAAVSPGAARAEFGPPQVVTATAGAQANGISSDPGVSGDGRYVVFRSSSSNLYGPAATDKPWSGGGIFRKDLDTGALEVVVPAAIDDIAGTSGAPSISADGRYVVFHTRLSLVVADDNAQSDVYRRDMTLPIDDPAAFLLVSVGTGQDRPITYTAASGSVVARHAVSADGGVVVFAIAGASNVLQPAANATTTAPGAIVARDIAAGTADVVNLDADGKVPLAGSKVGTSAAASVTADGKMALWYANGANAYFSKVRDAGFQALVQRPIGAAADATRVVTGLSDPEDPACVGPAIPTSAVAPQPCDGVVWASGDIDPIGGYAANVDGSIVAVSAQTRGSVIENATNALADVLLVDMSRSGARKAATQRLTSGPTSTTGAGAGAISLSNSGKLLAFSATKWGPNLNPPTPTGPFPATTGAQPYLIDLSAGTIRLAGVGYDGSALDGGVTEVALSAAGDTFALQTTATNLFFGDANGAEDIAVRRELRIPTPQPFSQPPAPIAPTPELAPDPYLSVTATGTPAGGARVTVGAPWPGVATIDVRRRATAAKKGAKARTQPRILTPVTDPFSAAGRRSSTLVPRPAYRSTLRRSAGISAVVSVTFVAPGRPTLTRSLPITLRRLAIPKTPAAKKAVRR